MVRTILVPLDGSPAAEEALPTAVTLAVRLGARLVLLRPVSARARLGEDPDAGRATRCVQAHAYLQDRAATIHDGFPMLHIGAEVPVGPWPNVVLDAAALGCADLIVASTRLAGDGAGAPAGLLGSAAVMLSRRSEVPVLLVPRGVVLGGPEPNPLPGRDGRPMRVLIPLDGSATAEAVLPIVVRYGATLPMRATVLHVVRPYEVLATGAAYCERVARWLGGHGVPARVELRSGTPTEEIARAAFERADLVALGLPEALPWRFGYKAEQLLRLVKVPVLQLRSRRSEGVVPKDASGSSGMAARTVVPPPGVDSTVSRPPTRAMRS
jgi:nucleotide-binding universal stress UspA family protein